MAPLDTQCWLVRVRKSKAEAPVFARAADIQHALEDPPPLKILKEVLALLLPPLLVQTSLDTEVNGRTNDFVEYGKDFREGSLDALRTVGAQAT